MRQPRQHSPSAPRAPRLQLAAAAALLCLLTACSRPDPAALAQSAAQRLERDDLAGAVLDARAALQARSDSAGARLTLAKALLASGQLEEAATELRRAREGGSPLRETTLAQAALLLRQGDARAVIALGATARLETPAARADLLVLVARAHAMQQRDDAMAAALAEALRLAPEHTGARLQLARLAGAKGQWAKAEGQVDAVLARDAKQAEAWLLKGEIALQRKSDDKAAEALLRKAIELRPGLQAAHARLILLQLARKDLAAATTQAQAMARAVHGDPRTDHMQALVALATGHLERARGMAQRATRAGDSFPPALYLAGIIEQRAGATAHAEKLLAHAMKLMPAAPEPRRELAALYASQGQGAQALDILTPLLKPQSTDVATWRAAGQIHTVLGDFRRADAAFARATRLDPRDAATRLQNAQSLLARGSVDLGIAQMQSAARLGGDHGADMALVAAQMSRGRHDAALEALDALDRKQPPGALSQHVRGQILAATGKTEAARKAFEAALAKDATYLPAVHGLAALDARADNLAAARARYEAVVQRDPRAAPALLALANITRMAGGSRSEAAGFLDKAVRIDPGAVNVWRQALDHHRRAGDTEGLVARARDAVAAVPEDADLLLELGSALTSSRDPQQALTVLEKAVRVAPGSAAARLRLAQALIDARRPEKAAPQIGKALALAPDWAPALRSNLALLAQDAKPEKALAFARRTQARLPKSAIGWQLEAELAQQRQDSKSAIAALRTAVAKADGNESALHLHRALMGAGQAAEADRFAQAWLKAHAGDEAMNTELGHLSLRRADWALAETHYRAALGSHPGSPLLLNNLAYVLLQRKDSGALAMAQRAVRGAPDLAPAVDTLALAYAANAHLDKAIEWQKRAVALAPKTGLFRLQLARFHLRAGEKDKAREQLMRLQDQGSDFPAQDEVRRLLGRIEA
ncbi:putative PEP-CTERM system TPR-repeat lipoprotein [Rubrivivax sp. A210]|uniref:XrtA/PEP-CTERM system TPR-repeat protein PrsT n=1 Tax=Rubrivivax sp. A210 TaxID=2772301 RepID=UPI001919729C|nr:XrtA/PEP-CTERM system TPR-repeat protein PrsT [Rubrivivax sp. A210]CAD5374585.1 putative PEP-CTERM system TPR-repeat lipoprotein [Rubrivivax sp. A210]